MKSWRRGCFILLVLGWNLSLSQNDLTKNVNPFIGTGGHGHTFPGAVLPFGMVQLSPDTRIDDSWDGCSGYHYSDSVIYGFSHTHLSGTGVPDWADILLMPQSSVTTLQPKDYASRFSHGKEKASPGYYEVKLERDNIKVELSTTLRTGIHRYTFTKGRRQAVLLDLLHRDKTLDCDLKIIDSVTVSGYRLSYSWAKEQHLYFVIRFSKPVSKIRYARNRKFVAGLNKHPGEKPQGAVFEFAGGNGQELMVKVGISSVSEEGALKNLSTEAGHWSFDTYKNEAENAWNRELRKVEISPRSDEQLKVFYTAMYHCFIHPSLAMDVDGQYRGRDLKVHTATNFTNYSVFSLWDTYRGLNPLLTILQPARMSDFINTFLVQYKQGGRLPVWELSANETDCMIGFHSVPVIADAFVKGIKGYDTLLAYEAMKSASNDALFGLPIFNKQGFLQVDDESESVSKTLEYGFDDWCIAKMAERLGKKDDEAVYLRRSQAYQNIFDDSTGLMRPRKNGGWLGRFRGTEVNNYYTEGNSWQWSFYVPHDLSGLIRLHGGEQNFEKKLDQLFNTSEKMTGRAQADVTGLIGQYAHGNEPSHHIAYLYNRVGATQKTVAMIKKICSEFYRNSPDGLIGNEDCGQMSAWYVFSALGMYPVCPVSGNYDLGWPAVESATVHLVNGKDFIVNRSGSGAVFLNGKTLSRPILPHQLLAEGGRLEFPANPEQAFLAGIPGETVKESDAAFSIPGLIPAPLISAGSQIFKDRLTITIAPLRQGSFECTYTTDGSEPSRFSKKYTGPFQIDSNCTVKARAFSVADSSVTSAGVFYKIKYPYQMTLNSITNVQYTAEGGLSLIDGIRGSVDWRKGYWLGVQEKDFECTADLKASKVVKRVSFGALQDTRSWIIFPKEVSVFGSLDGKKYHLLGTSLNNVKPDDYEIMLKQFEIKLDGSSPVRYIKIKARNFGKLPEWHLGSGCQAFIFADEIGIE